MPTTTLAPVELVATLKRAWRGGAPPDAAGALRLHPELLRHRSLVVDLAYEEYCLREEAGRTPATESFCRDLPAFRSDVREVIRGHRALMDHPDLLERVEVDWPTPGESFEGFRVVRELGRGAFARAYLALDPDTGNRPVVLKLSPTASDEARTLGPVRHPHIAEVLWARRVNGVSALCMRFVGAATLRDVVAAAFDTPSEPPTARTVLAAIDAAGQGLPAAEAVSAVIRGRGSYAGAVADLAARLVGALAFLHARGVTHGDLKPSNIIVGTGGHPYLIDFNLAVGDTRVLHRYGGTLPYMPPECVRRLLGEAADARRPDRADVYSFGSVLYEALTGQVPYPPIDPGEPATVAADLLRRQLAGPPPPMTGVPAQLARLVGECLAIDPDRRPTAADLGRRLNRFADRRRRWARAAAAAAAVVVVGSAVEWQAMRGPAAPAADPVVAVTPPASVPMTVEPVTADDFIARGFTFLRTGDPNSAFLEFVKAQRQRPDGRTVALMGYARTSAHSSSEAVRLYTEAIEKFGYRPAWVLNNRAYEAVRADPGGREPSARAVEDAQAALNVASDLTAAKYNRARAAYFLHLDRERWCIDDKKVLDTIERDLADVVGRHPNALKLHMFMAEVLAAPTWADDDRLDRAIDHLRIAIALGKAPRSVVAGPILRRALKRPGASARLDMPLPSRTPEPIDLGVAPPPPL